jgi:transposase-like protein
MSKSLVKIKKQRRFSEEFKREMVNLYESGQYSVLQLEKLYNVDNVNIYNWIYKYSNYNEKGIRVVEMKDSHLQKIKELEEKVKLLEQTVGQKQIKIDYLEKMIDLASEDYKIDIKKNSNSPRSDGSEKTKRK